ncbi:hypothetical protein O6H91_09G117700 [Diphasiastrum complanatum]|uniref:Uncharacterized protein n=1 Tax=Diphasiastrum complanatum TaxID=34168 RepID=A0ACC2CTR1_DIPCM|nr:hypothetical protein O6H91_09G117700 [Diphasiastrum complanatum]
MMNIKAIVILLTSLGTAMFFSPEPYLERLGNCSVTGTTGLLGTAKHATADTLGSAADYARRTADEIRHAGESTVHAVGGAAETAKDSVKHAAHCVGDAVTCIQGDAADKEKTASEIAGEKVRKAADYVKETTEGLREKSASSYDSVIDKANLDIAKETVKRSASDFPAAVKDSLVQSVSEALKKGETTVKKLWKKAENSRDQALEGVGILRASLMQELNFSEEGKDEEVARKTEEYCESIKRSFELSALKIVEFVEAIKEAARETIKSNASKSNVALGLPRKKELTLQELLKKKPEASEVGTYITGEAKEIFEDAEETMVDMGKKAGEQASELSSKGKEYVQKAMDQSDKKQNIKENLRRVEEQIGHKLQEAGQQANQTVGMMRGIANRAKSMIATVTYKSFQAILRLVHLFSFSTIFGMSLWVTFISGLILAQSTSKQQFGYLQSRIFPIYFRIMAFGEALLLVTHALLHPWPSADSAERWQYQNLFWSLFMTLLNIFLLEPLATKIMFERLKMEKEEGRGLQDTDELAALDERTRTQLNAVNRKFNRMHNYSSAANLASLACLTYHLWHLDRRLVM